MRARKRLSRRRSRRIFRRTGAPRRVRRTRIMRGGIRR